MLRFEKFVLIGFIAISLVSQSATQAQDDVRERRRRFVEDVLRNVLESQINPNALGDGRGAVQPPAGRTVPNVPQSVVDVRRQIKELSAAMDQLVRGLYQASDQSPLLRSMAADALQIRAQCDIAGQTANQSADLQTIATNFAFVDRQWRVFHHRVTQAPGLGRDLRRMIEQIAVNEANICKLLGLSPQLDRTELVRLTSAFTTSFEYLLQDLRAEARGNRWAEQQFRIGERFYAEVRQAFANVERAPYETIVSNYRDLSGKWRRWSLDLRQVPSLRIQQDVLNLEQINSAINDLLWLDPEYDREYVVDLLVAIRNDIDGLISAVTLKDLLACESPQPLINAARDFQSACASLASAAATASGPEDLAWIQLSFDKTWTELQNRLTPLNIPAVQDRLASCGASLEILRQMFGSRSQVNLLDIESSIAELDELTHLLQEAADAGLVRDRGYDAGFRQAFAQLAAQLHVQAHTLHTRSARNHSIDVRPQDIENLSSTWDQLRRMFTELRDPHRQTLGQFRAQIEPLLARLQMVFVD